MTNQNFKIQQFRDKIAGAMWNGMSSEELAEITSQIVPQVSEETKCPSVLIGSINSNNSEILTNICSDMKKIASKYDLTFIINGQIFS